MKLRFAVSQKVELAMTIEIEGEDEEAMRQQAIDKFLNTPFDEVEVAEWEDVYTDTYEVKED